MFTCVRCSCMHVYPSHTHHTHTHLTHTPHSHTLTHTHTHSHSLARSHTYTHTHTHTHTHPHTHAHTHTLTHSRDELIEWFVRLQLSDYEVMYHDSLEGAWLDKVDRRYSWLKRTLVNYQDESMSIFPPEWGIPERMCVRFCNMTRYLVVHYCQYQVVC